MMTNKPKAKVKKPHGRPTKCTPELIALAEDYLKTYKTKYKDSIPSVVGLALVVGVRRETLHVWAQEDGDFYKENFADIMADLNASQERVLINGGLDGSFNSNITKLVLGKHNYHDKQETELSGKDGGAIETTWTVEIVDARNTNTKKD